MWAEQDLKRRKGEAGTSEEDSGVRRTKRCMLVGYVSEYQRFYKGEVAD